MKAFQFSLVHQLRKCRFQPERTDWRWRLPRRPNPYRKSEVFTPIPGLHTFGNQNDIDCCSSTLPPDRVSLQLTHPTRISAAQELVNDVRASGLNCSWNTAKDVLMYLTGLTVPRSRNLCLPDTYCMSNRQAITELQGRSVKKERNVMIFMKMQNKQKL